MFSQVNDHGRTTTTGCLAEDPTEGGRDEQSTSDVCGHYTTTSPCLHQPPSKHGQVSGRPTCVLGGSGRAPY